MYKPDATEFWIIIFFTFLIKERVKKVHFCEELLCAKKKETERNIFQMQSKGYFIDNDKFPENSEFDICLNRF